jgi:MoaA/NifB/PqqE/SkfB family radical SAM enzyme
VSLSPVIEKLPILILTPHNRCNCRCVMCDIWKNTDAREMSAEDLEQHVSSIERLGVEWAVFTGGEPLMHSDLFRLCDILRSRGIRVTVLSSGLLLDRHAAAIIASVDDVIVSLDGPPAVHDRIRGVPTAFHRLETGVRIIHEIKPDFPISARCTIQRANCSHLRATVATARRLGLTGISFLGADLTSTAFNRPLGWPPERQAGVALTDMDLALLEAEIESLVFDDFVAETPQKLRNIAARFRGTLSRNNDGGAAPVCNAPWVSAVVEAGGAVRPCFFHPPIGQVDSSTTLLEVLNSSRAVAFRAALDVASNPVCRRCVCSLNWHPRSTVK